LKTNVKGIFVKPAIAAAGAVVGDDVLVVPAEPVAIELNSTLFSLEA
jgi:hypothetical protein